MEFAKNRAWLIAVVGIGIFTLALLLPFLLLPKGWYWLMAAVLMLPLIPVLESLLLTPFYRITGRFRYYSKVLFATQTPGGIELHVGTLFDYVSNLRWQDRGAKAQRFVVVQMLQGLLHICDEIEQGNITPEMRISGTSYFFSRRTTKKLGFSDDKVNPVHRLNLMLVSLSLALRLMFTKGRWNWPDLTNIRHIHISASCLQTKRADILRLLQYLSEQH